jgi:methyltransferase (TIGR00027 family)
MAPPRRAAARGPGRFDRRPWASGTTVFEIDQPSVVEWKTRTLREMGAEPSAWLRTVAVDLRHDWPAALRAAGFDPAAATAWSAEGLLAFLPSDAQDRLLDNITASARRGAGSSRRTCRGATALQQRCRIV